MNTASHPSHTLILGLGLSGLATAQWLHKQGERLTAWDEHDTPSSRAAAETLRKLSIPVILGSPRDPKVQSFISSQAPFTRTFISPGIDPRRPEIQALTHDSPLTSELDLVAPHLTCPIIAITGTNGKTTTTELIHHILITAGKRSIAAGNIGTPITQILDQIHHLDYLVLEVSSFQLEQTHLFHPHIALILNITPDHLDRYDSFEAYARTKWKLTARQTPRDTLIHNANLTPLLPPRAQSITFTASPHLYPHADYKLENNQLIAHGTPCLSIQEIQLIGKHNAENLLAALAAADALHIPREATLQALRSYKAQAHRCEPIATLNGVLYVNDSKGTNLDAVVRALEALDRPTILIAGGKDKDLDFASIAPAVARYARHAVLIGEARHKIQSAWQAHLPTTLADSLEEAVNRAASLARAGEAVLLSPGCASFDMFRDYKHRGETFRQYVLTKLQPQNHITTST